MSVAQAIIEQLTQDLAEAKRVNRRLVIDCTTRVVAAEDEAARLAAMLVAAKTLVQAAHDANFTPRLAAALKLLSPGSRAALDALLDAERRKAAAEAIRWYVENAALSSEGLLRYAAELEAGR